MEVAYLVDVLALKLGDEHVETVAVGLNTNGVEDLLDVGGGGGLLAAEGEEEVSCEVLHGDGVLEGSRSAWRIQFRSMGVLWNSRTVCR